MASFAAIFAIGKPVAFDASALERETRGFISMTISRPVSGSIANWMLQPPVSTPTARMIAMPTSRMCWYSRSVSVSDGATVIESPVWTPIGSKFSIEQMTTTLSLWSRISSSSYSFQPRIDSSRSTSVVSDACRPAPAMRVDVGLVVRDARTRATHRERRTHDHRVAAELVDAREDLVHRVADHRAGGLAADVGDDLLEQLAVLAALDRVDVGTDQLDVVLLQHAGLVQADRRVERGLAAERRQQRVGTLLGDDLLEDVRRDRLDVRRVGELRVGHDRGRVAVDQDHAQALGLEHAAGLGAGVVELAGLTDDDRAGADDHDALDVLTARHQRPPPAAARRRRSALAWTSAPRSGRTGTPNRAGRPPPPGGTARRTPGTSRQVSPSTTSSLRHTWLTVTRPNGVVVGLSGVASTGASTAKPWFCAVTSTLPVRRSMTGHVDAAVAELQLVGAEAQRAAEDLVAEADAEQRHLRLERLLREPDGVVGGGRVARAVAQEDAVGQRRP